MRLERAERTAARLRTLAGRIGSAQPALPKSLASPGKSGVAGLRRRAVRPPAGHPERAGVRCPGCTLVALGTGDRCGWCGFLFAVLPPSRRPGHAARKPAGKAGARKNVSLSLTRRPRGL